MPGRTPPRKASRNSGSGFGKRFKVAKMPFSPEPAEKKKKDGKGASAGSRDRDGSAGRSRKATGKGRGRNGKANVDEPVNKYGVCKTRISTQLSTIRREQHHIDAYEMDGWKGASREKLRPADEIRKSQVKIFNCKIKVRELFRGIDMDTGELSFKGHIEEDTGEVDVEDVVCATCRDGDADDDNDILICDGYCDRAFHQHCVVPKVRTEDIPDEWLCPLCDARVDAFYTLNADFDLELDAADATWRDVFPEEADLDSRKEGPGQANEPRDGPPKNGLLDENWGSDEESDEDFAAGADGDDGRDDEDEPLSGSAHSDSDGGDDGDSGERRRMRDAMNTDAEVCVGKRRRHVVDYRKLNDEMFGDDEAFEGEAEDERKGGWGPSSPRGKAKGGVAIDRGGEGRARKRAKRVSAGGIGLSGGGKRAAPTPASQRSPRATSRAKAGDEKTPKKKFPDGVRAALEASFHANRFPSHDEMVSVGNSIGLTDHQVKVWFQNRRRPKKPRGDKENKTPAPTPP